MSLSAKQAAVKLGIDPTTTRHKLRNGELGGRLEKGRWVVDDQDIYAYKQRPAVSEVHVAEMPDGAAELSIPSSPAAPFVVSETAETGRYAGAWLLLAVGENRAFGSNDGYDDVPSTHYRWDDTVPNHARLKVGDPVVLWDKKTSLGASVISSIETARKIKPIYSCPNCGKAHIKARKTKTPRYRCFKCSENFDEPTTTQKQVLEFTASYGSSWVGLDGMLTGAALRGLCLSPKSQLSMRPLRWDEFRNMVAHSGGPELLTILEASMPSIAGGHKHANVRVRVGQGAFRRNLLATLGAVCVFTGPAPAAALEAAHLYSFAKSGEHHEYGGLLMRRDLHRLFDLGFIAINPRSLTMDVSPTLASYPMYSELDGKPVNTTLRKRQTRWLDEHWAEHRPGSD